MNTMDRAFEILASQYRPMLVTYLRAVVGDYHLAEDLVQETLLGAYESFGSFKKGGNFGAWLRGIARNKALMSRRAAARRHLLVDSRIVEGMEDVYGILDVPDAFRPTWSDRLETIHDCVAKLGTRLRRAVELVYCAGQGLQEAAESLGITFGAVGQRLFRARVLIRQCVERQLKGA